MKTNKSKKEAKPLSQDQQDKPKSKKPKKKVKVSQVKLPKENKAKGIKSQTVAQRKSERFLRTKMWVSYLISMMTKDRGKIPANIKGDQILIENNLYITKLYMSSIVQIVFLRLKTPVTLLGEITEELRSRGSKVIVDFTIKNSPFNVSLKDSGLNSRIRTWRSALDNPNLPEDRKERYARLLYTVEKVEEGTHLMKSVMYITLRSKSGTDLMNAELIVARYLTAIGAKFKLINADIEKVLDFSTIMSDYRDKSTKDITTIINSNKTLAQMLPNCSALNDTKGMYMGINLVNNSPYILDDSQITMGRILYCLAPSGVGKTVLGITLLTSALENGDAGCVMDIKGNEFTRLSRSCGGYIMSLRDESNMYINTYAMHKEHCTDETAEMYFKTRVNISKQSFKILSGLYLESDLNDIEELLEDFFEVYYISKSVVMSNRNTWFATLDLNPYDCFEEFQAYMTPEVQQKYSNISKNMLKSLRRYFTRSGTRGYIFEEEFDMRDIVDARLLVFDFGSLERNRLKLDPNILRLKFAYMDAALNEFIAHKYSQGIRTKLVLEEVQQVVDWPEVIQIYVESVTLRRAQLVSTIILGNSVSTLLKSQAADAIMENIRGILLGQLSKAARDAVVKEFDLEDYEDMLKRLGSDGEYTNAFLFVNRMQRDSISPILKVILDPKRQYLLYTPERTREV